jgi:hypothetical protein
MQHQVNFIDKIVAAMAVKNVPTFGDYFNGLTSPEQQELIAQDPDTGTEEA